MLLPQALEELERDGHAGHRPDQFAAIGFSYGGMSSIMYTATAEEAAAGTPCALLDRTLRGERVLPEHAGRTLNLPEGLKAIVIGYTDDHVVGVDLPKRVFENFLVPAEDRNFVTMTTDGHGLPAIYAGHDTTYNRIDAADRYAIWKLSDALFACVFHGESCEVALGNTPEQRFMGDVERRRAGDRTPGDGEPRHPGTSGDTGGRYGAVHTHTVASTTVMMAGAR